ncbi:MAG: DUF3159 domain-containing protein [Candidatus Leucobacter sulfamidivorax]|nr:DUF3159 domain-containing protein [Candidatus Leucobacter sulfamidivorax]
MGPGVTEGPASDPAEDTGAEAPRRASGGLGRVVEAGLSGEAVSAGGVLAVIGGWRGVVESLLPATVYLVTYVFTQEPRISAIVPVVIALIAVAVRLIRREPLSAAISGLLGVLVCAAAVLFTGEGSSYYVPGFWINAAWIAAHAVSLLVGWPLLGLLVGFLRGSLTAWRRSKPLVRAVRLCTVVWIALFAGRLAVQLPLYFADQAGEPGALEALGVARLVMGVPLFAVAAIFTWLVLSRVSATVPSEAVPSAQSSDE